MGGHRLARTDLARFATDEPQAMDDGNRFWPSQHRAGLTDHETVDSLAAHRRRVWEAVPEADEPVAR